MFWATKRLYVLSLCHEVDNSLSFQYFLSSAGLMLRILKHVVQLHRKPTQTLARHDRSVSRSPISTTSPETRILLTAFFLYYLAHWSTDPILVFCALVLLLRDFVCTP